MAVARITMTKQQFRSAAEKLLAEKPDQTRAARELDRASKRPGLTAELTGDEVRALVDVDLEKDVRWRFREALADVRHVEEEERRMRRVANTLRSY